MTSIKKQFLYNLENQKRHSILINDKQVEPCIKLSTLIYSGVKFDAMLPFGITRGFILNMIDNCDMSWSSLLSLPCPEYTELIDSQGNAFEIEGIRAFYKSFISKLREYIKDDIALFV